MITESCEGDASKVSIWTTAHLPLPKPHINSNLLPVDCCWVTGRVLRSFVRYWHSFYADLRVPWRISYHSRCERNVVYKGGNQRGDPQNDNNRNTELVKKKKETKRQTSLNLSNAYLLINVFEKEGKKFLWPK